MPTVAEGKGRVQDKSGEPSAATPAKFQTFHFSVKILRLFRGAVAQLARALPWHGRGQGFESPQLHQVFHKLFATILPVTKRLPLIVSAPHACSAVPKEWRQRIQLTDEQIWHFSDPFSGKTAYHPRAFSTHIAKYHRVLGDLNRVPTPESAFRKKDFHGGNRVWKEGQEPNNFEKAELLQKYWFPYYENIFEKLRKLIAGGAKRILFVDHHNTSSDHPAGEGREYMPAIVISNFGSRGRGARVHSRGETSLPASALNFFRKALWDETELGSEINQIYHGGYSVKWVMENARAIDPNVKVYGVQFEYNLGLIHNPLSGRNDMVAQEMLQKKVNRAITRLAEYLKCDRC